MSELVPNLRDLGGLAASQGRVVVPDRLFRSALPLASDVVDNGLTWPPEMVIDLRSPMEFVDDHPLTGAAASIHNISLLAELAPGQEPPASLTELYRFVLDTVPDRLGSVVELVAESQGSTLIHCAAGKDRTGIAVALILRLLGVERELVIADYLATNNHAEAIRRRLSLGRRVFERETPAHFLEVPVEAMIATLDRWDEHRFGVIGWVRDAGVEADTIETLKETLLERP